MTKSKAQRKVKISTNKSRKDMKRPVKAPKIARFAEEPVQKVQAQIAKAPEVEKVQEAKATAKIEPVSAPAVVSAAKAFDMVKVNRKMRERVERQTQPQTQTTLTAKEIKEQEIKKAISATNRSFSHQKKSRRHYKKMDFGFRRVALAMACAAVAVFAIVYFVNLNSPDISLKVAAMQTGIDAHYPNYIPRDYSLSDITSENGKVTLNFKNASTGDAFSLVEEKVDWGANDLYANFVRANYGENYVIISEGGLSIYISGSNAAWVNDGIFYKITTTAGSLTKKQLTTIATKL